MKLYVIRHGQTDYNTDGNTRGIIDEDMNEVGYDQAKKAKILLKNVNFDICFSSKSKRTIKTAEIIVDKKVPIIIDERINERSFGTLEGGAWNLKYTDDFWDYYLNREDYDIEPIQDFFNRIRNFLAYLRENYSAKTVLISSHGAVIRAIHFIINDFDKNTNMKEFKIDNCQILEYDVK